MKYAVLQNIKNVEQISGGENETRPPAGTTPGKENKHLTRDAKKKEVNKTSALAADGNGEATANELLARGRKLIKSVRGAADVAKPSAPFSCLWKLDGRLRSHFALLLGIRLGTHFGSI